MYIPLKNSFRKDLIVTLIETEESVSKRYLIKDPVSKETFEFGEEEYFLCISMDGDSTISQISTAFENRFGLAISEKDLNQFSAQISEFGLLEPYQVQAPGSVPASLSNSQTLLLQNPQVKTREEDRGVQVENQTQLPEKKKNKQLILACPNPNGLFSLLVRVLKPYKPLFLILMWLLIPGFILTVLTLINNFSIYEREQHLYVKSTPWIFYHLTNITSVNLSSKLAQGIVCTYYGEAIKEFGIQLRLGIVPRGYINKNQIWKLKREEQLWCFGTPILVRMSFFVLGILTWYCTRTNLNGLPAWALSLGYMGLTDFIFDSSPLWPSDGYKWLMAYFRLSPKLIMQNRLIWQMMLTFRPLPRHLTFFEKFKLKALAAGMVIAWGFLAFLIARHAGFGILESISPGIFSPGAAVVIIAVPFGLALHWWITMQMKTGTSKKYKSKTVAPSRLNQSPNQPEVADWSVENIPIPRKRLQSFGKKTKSWAKNLVRILLIVGFGILLFWPYPYRPGGSVQLLPPTQQQIQAQVDGKITQVFFKGGDGQWIKTGTVIANMEAVDLENSVLITQEQVRQQQAEVEKQQANLNKLLATPKKEDVEVAKQQVEVAKQQVEVANQQVEVAKGELQTAIGKAEFSARQAARFNELYKTGAFSLQQYENAQKEAQTDRNTVEEKKLNVEEVKQNVKTKQQNLQTAQANLALVMSGPYPQDIEAARKEVEAAQATLKRLQQQLKYNQEQIKRTPLEMPIDGYLVTSDLDQKMGRYLKQGEVFAVAEDNRNIRGEVRIPEYNVGEFAVNGKVEIKLLAYPDKPLTGKVISIEPTASTTATGSPTSSERSENSSEKFIRVIIDIPNTEKILKAGMSGYAKIEGRTMPLILAFMRPVIRFLQIEVWSWIP
jgi:multidrug resistance efflux pump